MNSAGLPIASTRRTFAYFAALVGRHRRRFALVVALTVAAALTAMVTPYLVGRLTEDFADWVRGQGDPGANLELSIAVIVAAVLAQAGLVLVAYRQLAVLGERIVADVREEFVERALTLPTERVESAGTGELLSRTTIDVGQVQMCIANSAPQFFTGMVTLSVYLGGALFVSPLLGAAILLAVPPMAVVLRWYFRRSYSAFHNVQTARAELTDTVAQTVDGIRTVEALGWQRRRVAQTDRAIDGLLAAQMRTMRLRRTLFPVLDFSAFLPCLTSLVLGGVLVGTGHVSLAQATTIVLIMQLAVAPAIEMILSLEWVQIGAVSLSRLVGIDGAATESAARPDRAEDDVVEFKAVTFGYSPGRPVLRDVDLTVRRGERLALVGPTGAGKSTLARLMAGIHRPDQGRVALGGVDADEIGPKALRRFVMLATQEYHLFHDTLASNLRMGSPDAADEDLHRALEAVGAASWASRLPEGLSTVVGGRDHALTPAQVQQVALARVILAAPEVVVLDEATSMLSANAASDIERGLDRMLEGRTVVSIAHRLNTAHDADRVAVVEHGRITELGSHDELIAKNGSYAALWRRWHG
jgi:ABC-type multidrug transport system fused ATPase/permease subunit